MLIIIPSIISNLQNEIESLSKVQHQNVVSLLGYCIHDEARFLVYEMMENGSLEFHLHGKKKFMFFNSLKTEHTFLYSL